MIAHSIQAGPVLLWLVFFIIIAVMISIDLFLLGGGRSHHVSKKESLGWTLIWFVIAVGFNSLYFLYLNETQSYVTAITKSTEFFTAYLIEKSLSLDNIFVIAAVFSYFAIPKELQRRVLLYGVLGAIVMRFILISIGLILINQFQWMLYLLGALLFVTGIKMFVLADEKPDIANNPVLIWLKKHLSITHDLHDEKFTIWKNKKRYFTPLFLVLVLIEITDLVFAMDSIPAVFAITNDTFIVFTSNIFAILGLRALYFLLSDLNEKFHYLKYGIASILIFVGMKMLVVQWIHIPILLNLAVITMIISVAIFSSVFDNSKKSG